MTGTGVTPSGRAGQIRMAARVGVWGLLLALVPALAEAVGLRVAPGVVGPISSVGLIASGLGTIAASILVWRSLPGAVTALKLACVVGVPLGVSLVLGGLALQRPLSGFADRIDAMGPVVLGLAASVFVLLVIGFVRGRSGD